MRERAAGLTAGFAGVVVLSPDSLLLRFAECDGFAASSVRGLVLAATACLLLAVFPSLRAGFRWKPFLLYALIFGTGTACFVMSIKNTHIANALVIIASAPLFAAAGARIFTGEVIAKQTWAAALAVALGVAAIFIWRTDASFARAGLGDLFALGAALSLACTSIILRQNRGMSAAPGLALGGVVAGALTLPFADFDTVTRADFGWLFLNGALVVPAAFLLTAYAARRLPPPETTLLFLLETVIATLLAWWFLDEKPPLVTVAAGAVILGSVISHSAWSLRRK